MGFLQPAALLFALPLAWLWWRTRPTPLGARIVRALAFVCLVAALAGAFLPVGRPGRDLIVVVDRSRSMPADSLESAEELLRLAESERRDGDRLAVVSFGANVIVERAPSEDAAFDGFRAQIDPDGSDLAGALDLALGLVPRGRPASILVLSDGAATGAIPEGLAQRSLARGVAIDVRPSPRASSVDLSVDRIELPETIGEGEPYQFSVWVRASRAVSSQFKLTRGDVVLSSGERLFEPGLNRLVFRDVLERGGVAEYAVELEAQGDATPENNRGVGAVLVRGAARVLVLNEAGGPSTLAQALTERGVRVDVRAPEDLRLTPLALTTYRGVVLENIDAGRLGEGGMTALVDFVERRGGGLLVTGGRASFGRGGYYRSPLDPLLPISLELRQEHRKQAVAMSIVMDRSGSMSAPVDGVRSKMDLANAGAAAAIETLGDIDSVSVIAVDSAPHVVFEQSGLDTSRSALLSRVRTIASSGGGIFCRVGLEEAIRQFADDPRLTKHIILFADAADSEQKEGCIELLTEARGAGVSCSVIALGTDSDQDAAFLRAVALAGEGTVSFTTSPTDLPRLFAQDTLLVARSNFIEEVTGTESRPGLLGLGDLPTGTFPALGGYNLTYLRPEATAAVITTDEYRAPVLAFAYRGLGRAAAYTGQIGGEFGGSLVDWDSFSGFATGLVRWLIGTEEPGGLFASVERDGARAAFRIEVDRDAPIPAQLGRLTASALLPDGSTRALTFERTDASTFEATTELARSGTAIATVTLPDGSAFQLPPVSLPYSPEFAEVVGTVSPDRLLRRLAQDSGGQVLASAAELFEGSRGDLGSRPIVHELVLAALLLLLLEIAFRRLALWGAVASALLAVRRNVVRALTRPFRSGAPLEPERGATGAERATQAVRSGRGRRRGTPAVSPERTPGDLSAGLEARSEQPHDAAREGEAEPASESSPRPSHAPEDAPRGTLSNALEDARRRASDRLGRDR
ncbi:von Willebrand factor type A domain protein [Planctomycetes bacterium Pla163]|uniref:von Willebrand factor type A domain protein n=1 Tax=Rohdeia mirabilis TaxID=2528008 RepID=A0A518CYV9_9BACT|nr:von Willebrand factor type A domain protein [Planctomycetes bacterium Pla163]